MFKVGDVLTPIHSSKNWVYLVTDIMQSGEVEVTIIDDLSFPAIIGASTKFFSASLSIYEKETDLKTIESGITLNVPKFKVGDILINKGFVDSTDMMDTIFIIEDINNSPVTSHMDIRILDHYNPSNIDIELKNALTNESIEKHYYSIDTIFGQYLQETIKSLKGTCTCGTSKSGGGMHSSWCDI